MSPRSSAVRLLALLLLATPSIVAAQATAHRDRAEIWRDTALLSQLRHGLAVNTVGISRSKTGSTVTVRLEGWKQSDLSEQSLLPIARHALSILLDGDPAARSAKTLNVQFSDYTPHVRCASWTATEFRRRSDARYERGACSTGT